MPVQSTSFPESHNSLGALGPQLLTAFPGVTVVAASVFDAAGEAVWSTGTLAPDEGPLVQDALDAFSLEPGLSCFERDQQNGRTFVVFPLRCPRGQRRGAAALVLATRTLGGSGREKLLDPALQIILKRLSIAVAVEAGPDEATVVRPVSDALGVNGPPGAEFLMLYVQQMLKLRTSGRTRRYEVLLRSSAPGESEAQAPAAILRAADEPDISRRNPQASRSTCPLVRWQTRASRISSPARCARPAPTRGCSPSRSGSRSAASVAPTSSA
jgi:hypothetical protein